MGKDKRKRDKKKVKQKTRRRVAQRQLLKRKQRSLHKKHRDRRKKDCILGMPFIMAFVGDPARLFYCADIPKTFELIPRTSMYPWLYTSPFERLQMYLNHHVTQMHGKVLIYKAA